MKSIVFGTFLILASFTSIAGTAYLGLEEQNTIIRAMLDSSIAQNAYLVGEASVSEIIERDLIMQNSGELGSGQSVTLSCSEISSSKLQCSLKSISSDEFGESALIISANIDKSDILNIKLSNVRADIAS